MYNIGIIGMGRMGRTIAGLLERRNDISFSTFSRITPDNQSSLQSCDVAIEFTIPEAAPGVIRQCIDLGIPVISGTTGWHEYSLDSILTHCKQHDGTFLYATNFSIGMNIMFALNRNLTARMNHFHQFVPALKEIHHIHKKDAPSGTAYTLIEDIIKGHATVNGFEHNPDPAGVPSDTLHVTSVREGEVKGIHEVTWTSPGEKILIAHEAFDRAIFAEGAIMAAQWLIGKPSGIYTMSDIIEV